MRRLVRQAVTLCSAASLLLCVVACVVWGRSHVAGMSYHFTHVDPPPAEAAPLPKGSQPWVYQYHLAAGAGRLQLVRRHLPIPEANPPGATRVAPPHAALYDGGTRLGPFQHDANRRSYHSKRNFIGIEMTFWGFRVYGGPAWLPAAVFAVAPVLWLRAWRRGGREPVQGHCRTCGYDLRASPGRCPECGTVA